MLYTCTSSVITLVTGMVIISLNNLVVEKHVYKLDKF